MADRPLYRVLEIPQDASAEDVKRAYKRLALRLHPDKNGGDATYAEEFKAVNEAYAVLGDPARREAYDRTGVSNSAGQPPPPPPPPGFINIEQMFGHMFNMSPPMAATPMNDVLEVEVSARELYDGCTKQVEYSAPDMCGACDGTGAASPDDVTSCIACNGSGRFAPPGMFIFGGGGPPCPACRGKGRAFRTVRRCTGCSGAGTCAGKRRTFAIRIPPGVTDGHCQTLPGKGGYDAQLNTHRGIEVHIRRRSLPDGVIVDDVAEGDVTLTVPLTLADVLCGFKAVVDVFDGAATVKVGADAYMWPGRSMTFPNMGLHGAATGKRGVLRIRFDVKFPSDDHVTATNLVKYRDVLCRALEGHNS